MDSNRIQKRGITRRGALVGAAMFGVGVGLDHLLTGSSSEGHDGELAPFARVAVPFNGSHQAGIDTPAQEFLDFAAFDVTSTSIDDLRDVLKQWTVAAAALTAGGAYEHRPGGKGGGATENGEGGGVGPPRGWGPGRVGPPPFLSPGGEQFGPCPQ